MTDVADASRQLGGPVAAATGQPTRPFVGRVRELSELRAAPGTAAPRGSLFLVTGTPGIGKSRLMEELARLLGAEGWRVLVGRCWEHGGAPAYWPWMQVVRAAGGELEACFPSTPPAPDPETARFMLFDAVGRLLRAAADTGPVLVILDDLHAADEPSLLLLRFLAQTVTDQRLMIVGAYRDVEPRVHELAEVFGDLVRVGRRLPLGGLSRPEVAAYIRSMAGRPPAEALAARVHDITGGNPLFVGELVRALVDGPLVDVEGQTADSLLRIPEELRGLLRRRLAGLPTEAVANLKVASVIGRDFELGILQRISRLSVGRLTEALAEAERAGIVSQDPSTPGRYTFSHELLREALYEDMPAARRLKLHRSTGLVLEGAFGDHLEPHLAELAHHFTRSAPLGDAALAVEYSVRAGDHAAALLAYEDAARHYERALHLLPMLEGGGGDRRWELLLRLGDVQWWAGDTEQAGRSFEQAAAVAGRLGAAESLAHAALGYVTGTAPVMRLGLGWMVLTGWLARQTTGIRLLEQALAALPEGDSPLRAQVLARLATELYPSGEGDRRTALAEAAVAMARRVGDRRALLVALHGRHWALLAPERPDLRLANAPEMPGAGRGPRRRGDGVPGPPGPPALPARAVRRRRRRRRAPGHDAARRPPRPAPLPLACGQPPGDAGGAGRPPGGGRAPRARHARDRRAAAERAHDLHVRARPDGGHPLGPGPTGRAAGHRPGPRDRYPSVARWRDALAAVELADEGAARVEIERHARAGFAELPRNVPWVLHLCALAEASVLIHDQGRAVRLYELLAPYADRNAVSLSTMPFGPVALRLGMLAAMLGRWPEAERHFQVAMERCRRLGARAITARVLYEWSRMLLARGAGDDRAAAVELLSRAQALCRELHLAGVAERVAALTAAAAQPARPEVAQPGVGAVFRREGDYWTLAYRGELARLRDARGLGYLACLLGRPGQEVHVLELVGAVDGPVPGGAPPRPA